MPQDFSGEKLKTIYWIGYLLSGNHDEFSIDQITYDIQHDKVNWKIFFQVGDQYWVLPSIFCFFRDHNLLEILPDELSGHLEDVYRLNREKNIQILAQINELTDLLNHIGIEPIYIKGAGNLIDGLYDDIGERFIGDIDFLVSEANFLSAANFLEQNGYRARAPFNPFGLDGMKHYPRLNMRRWMADVEIHKLLANPPFHKTLDFKLIDRSKKRPSGKMEGCFVLSDDHKAVHNFIHSQLNDRGYFRANPSLRQMYDLVLLAKRTNIKFAFKEFGHYYSRAKSYLFLVKSVFYIPDDNYVIISTASSIIYHFRFEQNIRSAHMLRKVIYLDKTLQPIRYYGRNLIRAAVEKQYRKKHINRLLKLTRNPF